MLEGLEALFTCWRSHLGSFLNSGCRHVGNSHEEVEVRGRIGVARIEERCLEEGIRVDHGSRQILAGEPLRREQVEEADIPHDPHMGPPTLHHVAQVSPPLFHRSVCIVNGSVSSFFSAGVSVNTPDPDLLEVGSPAWNEGGRDAAVAGHLIEPRTYTEEFSHSGEPYMF